jgi:uncharacterized RDD family membrane protein YckC
MNAPPVESERDIGLQGTYAGFVTRFAGFLVDIVTIAVLFTLGGHVVDYIVSALRGPSFSFTTDAPELTGLVLLIWIFVYCAYPLAVSGRTFGMAVVGLRAVRRDGTELGGWHAVIRVLVFPLSFALFCFGFLLILLRRDRRALHDLIAGSAVVYSWNARAARLRFLGKWTA